jgi:hypothetical protein
LAVGAELLVESWPPVFLTQALAGGCSELAGQPVIGAELLAELQLAVLPVRAPVGGRLGSAG